jgi:hypothetical protein
VVSAATLGANVKITAGVSPRVRQTALYAGVFGCEVLHPTPTMDVFRFPTGACVGIAFVPDDAALTPTQAGLGAWLEFVVPDVDAATGALAELGIEPFEYVDPTHRYVAAPGGQIFRLAPAE